MFTNCHKLTTTITIRNDNVTYEGIFSADATWSSAKITVNYTANNSSLVDQMVSTKYNNSNVVKGVLIA